MDCSCHLDNYQTWLIAVAVVLTEGGNHAEEMSGGAAIIVTPLIPFRIAHAWQLRKILI